MTLEHLDFSSRTRKRAEWEAFEFAVVGPYQVRVTNASYGKDMHEHAYVVGIEARDGVLIPAECECPADIHGDRNCKHRVGLVIHGGSPIMSAAAAYDPPTDPRQAPKVETVADKLRSDGGARHGPVPVEPPEFASDTDDGCWCEDNDMPCFDCYRNGNRELPCRRTQTNL